MITRKETRMPTPSTSPTPDLPPSPLMDPAVIDAAAEEAHYAADKAEAVTFLSRLAQGNAERIRGYRTVGADPRIAQWTSALRKVEGKFPVEHLNVLEHVNGRLVGPGRWASEADQAEEAERQIDRLTGPECHVVNPETWKRCGTWNRLIDRLASRLLIVSRTEAQLRQELADLEPDVLRVLQLYAHSAARRAGTPPVVAEAPSRIGPLETVLDFNPLTTP